MRDVPGRVWNDCKVRILDNALFIIPVNVDRRVPGKYSVVGRDKGFYFNFHYFGKIGDKVRKAYDQALHVERGFLVRKIELRLFHELPCEDLVERGQPYREALPGRHILRIHGDKKDNGGEIGVSHRPQRPLPDDGPLRIHTFVAGPGYGNAVISQETVGIRARNKFLVLPCTIPKNGL